jgi:hypothetical protein
MSLSLLPIRFTGAAAGTSLGTSGGANSCFAGSAVVGLLVEGDSILRGDVEGDAGRDRVAEAIALVALGNASSSSLLIQRGVDQTEKRTRRRAVADNRAPVRSDTSSMTWKVLAQSVEILSLCCTAARIMIQKSHRITEIPQGACTLQTGRKFSRAGRNSGWPSLLPTHREVLAAS